MPRHLVAETIFLKDVSEIKREAKELGVNYDVYKVIEKPTVFKQVDKNMFKVELSEMQWASVDTSPKKSNRPTN